MEGRKIFSDGGKLKEFVSNRHTVKKLNKGNSSNRQEMIKEGISKHQEGRKSSMKRIKIRVHTIGYLFS